MFIDFDKLTLSYLINGIDYGVACKITQDKYRVAICLQHQGNSVRLL